MASATISSADGTLLATVALNAEGDGPVLVVSRVIAGQGNLLMHYFGEGARAVRVETGDATIEGTLATKWLGRKRLWLIRLAAPVPPGVPGPAEAHAEGGEPAVAARD
ncbi:MAG: hypothetical protein HY875_16250 [Chloroflexi bacterium]|nr:hypothetical protein [Chloroflexota bacterium]